MSKDIWVFAETSNGKIKKITYELLGKALDLAAKTGGNVVAVLLGHNISSLANELGYYGANRVFVADNQKLASYSTLAYSKIIGNLLKKYLPAIFLTGNTFNGKDLTPRLAAKLDSGAVTDVISFDCDNDAKVTALRPLFAGKVLETVKFNCFPQFVQVRNKAYPVKDPDKSRIPEIIDIETNLDDSDFIVKLKETRISTSDKIDLSEAEIVVSGGRGLKGPENFYLVENLAKVLGAAVGASRPVVDEGWVPYDYQVGQTGKVVSPKLYIACGISGAIQHLSGMSSSKTIVAINKDPDAPIFKIADYGIVGDVFNVLPALTEEIKKIKE